MSAMNSKMVTKLQTHLVWGTFCAVCSGAVGATEAENGLRFGLSLQGFSYKESLMQVSGPTVGIRAERMVDSRSEGLRAQAEIRLGRPDYSSRNTGDIANTGWLSTQWHADKKIYQHPWAPRPGLSISTEWNNLSGRSTTGNPGYERLNAAVWLTGSWDLHVDDRLGPTTLRAAAMLRGWQRSMLSQASRDLSDVTNLQHRGVWLAVETPVNWGGHRSSIRAGWRLVGRSDLRAAGPNRWVEEPTNRMLELSWTVWL